MPNLLVWLDIPAKDLGRAMKFYSNVLKIDVVKEDLPEFSLGMFPAGDNGLNGCIYVENQPIKNDVGPLIYLSVEGRLDDAERKVLDFEGEVLKSKHQIGPYGWRVLAKDSEGNRIALHSMKE
jgi:predicted enzyme related to lactoylglutathione lyase